MTADLARRHRRAGGGMTLIDVHDTRPGGPNRQERAHRVGVPESLTEAIKEFGMIQVHTCVSVHCDQCVDALGDPGFEAHYPTEDAALDAAAAQGWEVGPGGRLWCSACGPVLTCAVESHEFTEWRAVLLCVDELHESLAGTEHAAAPAEGHPVGREYRYCQRCCLHESRPGGWLIGALSGSGKTDAIRQRLLAAGTGAGEVA
ncbi:MAG: hypothetical protein JO063_07805 [Pseudonocardiales bacterium]|nr:hypothetical protein [Pseudonocardiales bacterium]MBV9028699.1 hypothetical protein [Pseudonocardiales bacterium]MBW0010006.1 hypothetical protein [Pseudonocardiales bacterium]